MEDEIMYLQIELRALGIANDRRTEDDDGKLLGDLVQDDDYRAAIREYFAEVDDVDEGVVDLVLIRVKEWIDVQHYAAGVCNMIIGTHFSVIL